MKLRYTSHQVARGTRADAETPRALFLLKKVRVLNATYQVRMLAYRAQQERKQLVIRGPAEFKAGPSLRQLMAELKNVVRIERTLH